MRVEWIVWPFPTETPREASIATRQERADLDREGGQTLPAHRKPGMRRTLEQAIERSLRPGAFVNYGASSAFVRGLSVSSISSVFS